MFAALVELSGSDLSAVSQGAAQGAKDLVALYVTDTLVHEAVEHQGSPAHVALSAILASVVKFLEYRFQHAWRHVLPIVGLAITQAGQRGTVCVLYSA